MSARGMVVVRASLVTLGRTSSTRSPKIRRRWSRTDDSCQADCLTSSIGLSSFIRPHRPSLSAAAPCCRWSQSLHSATLASCPRFLVRLAGAAGRSSVNRTHRGTTRSPATQRARFPGGDRALATTSGRHHGQAIRIDSFEVDDCGRPCDRPPCRAPPSGLRGFRGWRQLFGAGVMP